MGCSSFTNIKNDMMSKNLVNDQLVAPAENYKRLDKYLREITQLAKTKYKVDRGRLFRITEIGENNLNSDKIALSLIPNLPAFQAIDNSREFELAQLDLELSNSVVNEDKVASDIFNSRERDTESGTVISPKSLPALKIEC